MSEPTPESGREWSKSEQKRRLEDAMSTDWQGIALDYQEKERVVLLALAAAENEVVLLKAAMDCNPNEAAVQLAGADRALCEQEALLADVASAVNTWAALSEGSEGTCWDCECVGGERTPYCQALLTTLDELRRWLPEQETPADD